MNSPTEKNCGENADTTRSTTPEENYSYDLQAATIAMNLQIPEFWQDHPRSWFFKFEAIMSLQKQDDLNKFQHVISKLNKEAIQSVSDIVFDPPENGKYEAVKYRLLAVFEVTEEKKLEKMIKVLEISQMSNLMRSNLTEQNNLLRRIEQLLTELCAIHRFDNDSDDGWQCWYHQRFGHDSYRCGDELHCTFNYDH